MITSRINTSIKLNTIVALIIGLWLFVFIIFVKPFQDEPISIYSWLTLATGYSVIAFLSYIITTLLLNKISRKTKKWDINYEIVLIVTYSLVSIIPCFLFHKSNFSHGLLDFIDFLYKIFIPSVLIVTPLIIFSRRYLIKLMLKEEDIIIKGDSKRDYLKIKRSSLICVSNAHNYVEIYFLSNGTIKNKLLRSSLKKIQKDVPTLIKVHRSHLINPTHFISWKNQNTISLTQIEIPVSNNYKDIIAAL